MSFIELRDVARQYDSGEVAVQALRGITLDVEKGTFVALMGPSGCGKTTLLNLLGGMDRPSSGTVQVGDRPVHALPDAELTRWRRRRVGVIFQAFNLLPTMTVAENVELPLLLEDRDERPRAPRVQAVLQRVGLQHRTKHRPYQLSGGEMQRVAVARALVHEPDLIIADEPTGNLDSQHGEEVLQLLQEVAESGRTVVMATHSAEAAALTHRIVRLKDGHLLS